MKFTSKLIGSGNSVYLLVPANIRNLANLSIGDIVEVDITKPLELDSSDSSEILLHLRCKVCQHQFDAVTPKS